MYSSPLLSLFQLVPTRGAKLLWISASHDLLLAEHTLHTVGEGERGTKKMHWKIFKPWTKSAKSKGILKIVIPIYVKMSVMTGTVVTVVTSRVRLAAAGQGLKAGRSEG